MNADDEPGSLFDAEIDDLLERVRAVYGDDAVVDAFATAAVAAMSSDEAKHRGMGMAGVSAAVMREYLKAELRKLLRPQ